MENVTSNVEDDLRQALIDLDQIERAQKSRKKESGIDYYIPNAAQLRCHQSKAKIILFCGGNRCIAGETLIYDPVVGKNRSVDEISEPFHVYAWTGEKLVEARADTPFLKGFDALYRITLSNGKQLLATSEHRILTPFGFLSVSKLQPGLSVCTPPGYRVENHTRVEAYQQSPSLYESSELLGQESNHNLDIDIQSLSYQKHDSSSHQFRTTSCGLHLVFSSHPQTSLEPYQLAHAVSGQRLTEKSVSSQFDYHYESHLYGERSLQVLNSDLGVSPSPSGVLEYNHENSCVDGHGSSKEYNRSYQQFENS